MTAEGDAATAIAAARSGDEAAFASLVAPLRGQIESHCYRMVGCLADAEEITQDTLLKAWRALPAFEGRSSLRRWLYKIATNICLDRLAARQPRPAPYDLGPPASPGDPLPPPWREYVDPCPDAIWRATVQGPDAKMSARESVALAFLVAIEHLPPLQRAALVLRDVVGCSASEAGEILERSPAAVESALERARATTEARRAASPAKGPSDPEDQLLLARYLAAWESSDTRALTDLLREDALLTMPPFPLWISGRDAIHAFLAPILARLAAIRVRAVGVSGGLGGAAWVKSTPEDTFHPHALSALVTDRGRIAAVHTYLVPELFSRFGIEP